jgi:hypothetical protein
MRPDLGRPELLRAVAALDGVRRVPGGIVEAGQPRPRYFSNVAGSWRSMSK